MRAGTKTRRCPEGRARNGQGRHPAQLLWGGYRSCSSRFITGLTATPHRHDGLHPIIEMQLGPVRFTVDPKSQAARRPFEHRLIIRETRFTGGPMDLAVSGLGIQALYARLATDEQRNQLIVGDVVRAIQEGRSPILLTERKDHLEHLAMRLRPTVRHLLVLRSGRTPVERRALAAQLASIPDDEPRLVIATGRYIGEGFDNGRLDTLFLTMPVSWKGTIIQHTGRLHRLHRRQDRGSHLRLRGPWDAAVRADVREVPPRLPSPGLRRQNRAVRRIPARQRRSE
jgi:superfamily II DNA or RNA helicase